MPKYTCCAVEDAVAPSEGKAVVAHGHTGLQRWQQSCSYLLLGDDASAALDDERILL